MSIEVFGSAILRVEPDIVQLNFTASRIEEQPQDSIKHVNETARSIQKFLDSAGIKEVQASRLQLNSEWNHNQHRYTGYRAEIDFTVILKDLAQIEDITVGVVAAGANQVNTSIFQTGRLKELRAEARKKAVAAAKEKALLYCEAAGATLGQVLKIEDVNPDVLRGGESHVEREITSDENDPTKLFSPSSIAVRGAVRLTYALES